MKTLRTALSVTTILLLAVGYAASQFAWYESTSTDQVDMALKYAAKVDQTQIALLALLLFAAAVVLGFLPAEQGVAQDS